MGVVGEVLPLIGPQCARDIVENNLSLRGLMTMHFRDRAQVVHEGSMILVPRGVEHRPLVEEEAWIVMFEPQAIDHTGSVDSPHRRTTLQRV